MAYQTYRISFKSKENRGQGRPNTVELQFDSDADAIAFGENCMLLMGANLVSVDLVLSTNYTLPYPAGTNGMVRCAAWLSPYTYNFRVFDIDPAFVPATRVAALIAAGFKFPSPDRTVFRAPSVINLQQFSPSAAI